VQTIEKNTAKKLKERLFGQSIFTVPDPPLNAKAD
jgi:hypothetical protein